MATVTTPAGDVLEGVTGSLLDYYRGEGYVIVDDEPETQFPVTYVGGEVVTPPILAVDGEFDPAEHTVDEVNDYLAEADDSSRARVFDLERSRADKARVGILEGPFAPEAPAGDQS